MPDTFTEYLQLTKPEPGASPNTWGTKINANFDSIDAAAKAVRGVADAALPKDGSAALTASLKINAANPGVILTTNAETTHKGKQWVPYVSGDIGDFVLQYATAAGAVSNPVRIASDGSITSLKYGELSTSFVQKAVDNTITGNLFMVKIYPQLFMKHAEGQNFILGPREDGRFYILNNSGVGVFSVGQNGSIASPQIGGDLKGVLDTKFAAASFTASNIINQMYNELRLDVIPRASSVAYRDGAGRCQFQDSTNTGGGYTLINGDARIGRFNVANGYLEFLIDGVAYSLVFNASDRSLKENIQPAGKPDELSKINNVDFYSFDWKPEAPNTGHVPFGVIAQDMAAQSPSWVVAKEKGPMELNLQGVVTSLLRAVQQLSDRVRELEAKG